MSVEMREADHLMLQPKCLPVREQGTGDDTNAKPLSNNMLSPSFVNSNERYVKNEIIISTGGGYWFWKFLSS